MTDESVLTGKTMTHYAVLERIGAGGMGVVYKARDEHLDRFVAIKILPHEALEDESRRKRFRQEALALSKLNHPNIATVFDFDSQDGKDFLVMEYVPGEPLEAKLKKGHLTEKETAILGAELADGLAAAHKHGVIHRDLKPANLRLTLEGRLKILDFGLAKIVHPMETGQSAASTFTGAMLGTLPYMAPEQWHGERIDHRADIWAAGTVLYELATGRRAFDEPSGSQLAAAILTRAPTPPSVINGSLSPGFESIILKCLEKDPENRYQSAGELAVDLRRLGAPFPQRSQRRRWRLAPRTWLASAVSAALAAILILNIGGLRERIFGGGNPATVRSLAVLPLENLSRDPRQEYFSDGMTEELTATLGKISALRVISCSSARIFKGVKRPLAEIANALGVDALVEGSVLQSGDRVRITAELFTPKPEHQLWADSYERDTRDVIALQADVAQAIARQIRVRLAPDEASRVALSRPVNPAALEAYLRGRSLLLDRVDPGEYRAAAQQFEAAIRIDSTYAAPWAGLADMYYLISNLYLPPHEAMPKAESMAASALRLDGMSAEAHATLGFVRSQYYRDWEGAEKELHRAIQLNPSYGTARMYRAFLLAEIGQLPEALTEIRHARELDPESNYIVTAEGSFYYYAGMYDSAAVCFRYVIARDPGTFPPHALLASCYALSRMYEPAMREIKAALSVSNDPYIYAIAATTYVSAGKTFEAKAALDELVRLSKREHVPAYYFARAYAALGEKDQAFHWLDVADRNRDEDLCILKVDPLMRSLRSDHRFVELLHRLRLAS